MDQQHLKPFHPSKDPKPEIESNFCSIREATITPEIEILKYKISVYSVLQELERGLFSYYYLQYYHL